MSVKVELEYFSVPMSTVRRYLDVAAMCEADPECNPADYVDLADAFGDLVEVLRLLDAEGLIDVDEGLEDGPEMMDDEGMDTED